MKKISFIIIPLILCLLCSCSVKTTEDKPTEKNEPVKVIEVPNTIDFSNKTKSISQEEIKNTLNISNNVFTEQVNYEQLEEIISKGNCYIYVGDIANSTNKETITQMINFANSQSYPLLYFNINDENSNKLKEKLNISDINEKFIYIENSKVSSVKDLAEYKTSEDIYDNIKQSFVK